MTEVEQGKVICDPHDSKVRNLILTGPVDESMASSLARNLLIYNADDQDLPICMYVNTYGGSVYDMLAIYDVMQFIKAPIYTVGFGKVMSAGVLIMAAGEKGKRYALPRTSIMLHKARGGALGTETELEANVEHIKALQIESNKLIMKHSKLTKKQIENLVTIESSYITAKQAKEFGLIDHISAVQPRIIA
jgi:ATP-dependent Clp protease protease subunit